jgi:hypothetical protein
VVKLCTGDKSSSIFVYVNSVPKILDQIHCRVEHDLFLLGLSVELVLGLLLVVYQEGGFIYR